MVGFERRFFGLCCFCRHFFLRWLDDFFDRWLWFFGKRSRGARSQREEYSPQEKGCGGKDVRHVFDESIDRGYLEKGFSSVA